MRGKWPLSSPLLSRIRPLKESFTNLMEMQHRVSFLYFQPAYDSTRTLLYWLTMWAAYRFEKDRSSVKNVQIPTLQLEGARSSDKPLPMQIQCKYVCRPTHACVTVPSALLCKSYSALLRLKYTHLICTYQCTYLLQRQYNLNSLTFC